MTCIQTKKFNQKPVPNLVEDLKSAIYDFKCPNQVSGLPASSTTPAEGSSGTGTPDTATQASSEIPTVTVEPVETTIVTEVPDKSTTVTESSTESTTAGSEKLGPVLTTLFIFPIVYLSLIM